MFDSGRLMFCRTACLFALVCLFSLVMAPRWLIAQGNQNGSHWLTTGVTYDMSRGEKTKPGGPVVSFPCDPMMTSKQENELFKALGKESEFGWEPGTTVKKMAEDLSKHFPVVIDRRSLEEIGLDVDSPIGSGPLIGGVPIQPATVKVKTRWWDNGRGQSTSQGSSSQRPTLIVDVMRRLQDLYLTIVILHGQLVITTVEAAEDELPTRIYDVTPLVNQVRYLGYGNRINAYEHSGNQVDESVADFDSLMNLIETAVTPDTWEAMGGNSTIAAVTIRDRHWLVISTTSITHWKIQRLLDRLNH